MKIIRIWTFLGVAVTGLVYGPSALRAQPVDEPVEADDEIAPISVESVLIEGESTPADGGLVPAGDQNKPWNQGISVANRATARALFREGNRLFKIPLFLKAAEKYAAALSHWEHPAFYLNLAIAQLNSGQEVEALKNLERAVKHGEESLGPERFREAQTQLEEVKRQLGRIRVICRTPGAQVTLNGVPILIGPGMYEGWAKAREHEITARKPEYLSEARRVPVTSGQLQTIDLKLITLSEAADASRRWAVWKPWAVMAAGGVIMVTGGVLHRQAFRNFVEADKKIQNICVNESDKGCQGEPDDSENQDHIDSALRDYSNLLSRARRQQEIAVGAYIAGASVMAVGVTLLYLNRPRLTEQRIDAPLTRGITVAPTISNDTLAITLSVND